MNSNALPARQCRVRVWCSSSTNKAKIFIFSDVEVQIQAEDGSVMTDVLLPHIAMGIKEESLEETVENVLNRYQFQ